jgi:surfeit locus 1 family protein
MADKGARGPARLMHFRPLPLLTALAIPALAVLLTLGQWQWARFAEKRALDAAPAPAARPLADALRDGPADFAPVWVEGVWRTRTVSVYAVQNGAAGARHFAVFDTALGPLIAERGFVPAREAQRSLAAAGPARLEGVLRAPARANAFTPENDPERGVFYWPDTEAIAAALGAPPLATPLYLAPALVDPLGTGAPVPNPYADPRGANQLPADRHFGYALTWWGLAVALVGVYGALHWRSGRLRLRRPEPPPA